MGNETWTKLDLHLHNTTNLAIFVSKTGFSKDAVWLPKRFVTCEKTLDVVNWNRTIDIEIPKWLAIQRGFL